MSAHSWYSSHNSPTVNNKQLKEQLATIVHEEDMSAMSIDDGLNILRQFITPLAMIQMLLKSTLNHYRLPAVQHVSKVEHCINMIYTWIDKYSSLLYHSHSSTSIPSGEDVIDSICVYNDRWIDVVMCPVDTTDSVLHSFIKRLIETLDCVNEVVYAKVDRCEQKMIYTIGIRPELEWNVERIDMRKLYQSVIPTLVFGEPILVDDEDTESSDPEDLELQLMYQKSGDYYLGTESSDSSDSDPLLENPDDSEEEDGSDNDESDDESDNDVEEDDEDKDENPISINQNVLKSVIVDERAESDKTPVPRKLMRNGRKVVNL